MRGRDDQRTPFDEPAMEEYDDVPQWVLLALSVISVCLIVGAAVTWWFG